jgi:hypothetical protein
MPIKVANEAELNSELKKIWARVTNPKAQDWFKSTAKNHLLNLIGVDLDENFTLEPITKSHRFDPIQPMRRHVWRTMDRISIWFESGAAVGCDYPALSFAEASRLSEQWAKENRVA